MNARITPFLWFDGAAEEAARFYASIFRNSKIAEISRYGAEGPGPAGSTMTVSFELDGMRFVGLNGGPHYKFSPAISFVVNCATQDEVDYYWDRLVAGGEPQQCGWLTDRFGVSWQIFPTALGELLQDKDPEKSGRVMKAMLQMVKIDIKTLKNAYEGK